MEWRAQNPHRRWFLDYYRLPPSDPRFLDMTDDEIVFDFFTVRPGVDDDLEEDKAPVPAPTRSAPGFTETDGPNGTRVRTTTHSFQADLDDYEQWLQDTFLTNRP